jgi:hypothetical protein
VGENYLVIELLVDRPALPIVVVVNWPTSRRG